MSQILKFSRESVADVYDSVLPLLTEHFLEISANLDIALNPDKEMYLRLDKHGTLRLYIARIDEEFVGYAVYFVAPNPHYKQSTQAKQDVVFIKKEHRGFGESFINWCDEQLKSENVQIVYHHVKAAHNWGHMLERNGYKMIEYIYSKRLDLDGQ